ncbi:hypothetical protein ACFQ5Q_00795 [Luteolibacter ambystomatis]|uniref:hypothetical protein n=1 Tax=Luteolibacter ambystomatis TaxID=2824561 RepID=UPI0036435431
MRRFIAIALCGVSAAGGVTLPELPPVSCGMGADGRPTVSWQAYRNQLYRVERSQTLAPGSWTALSDIVVGDGLGKSIADPQQAPKAYYRVSVIGEDFNPSVLAPKWQLDATIDFQAAADGSVVSQWKGSGITSNVQTVQGSRPVYQGGSVVFDGAGDNLQFPMWAGGVGSNWTLVLLVKVRPGITNYSQLFGGSFEAGRALEAQWFQGDIATRTVWDGDQGLTTDFPLFPNDNWRVVVLRSGDNLVKTKIDGSETTRAVSSKTTGQAGTFNLGCSYDPVSHTSPITVRYAAFFPTMLGDADLGKFERWLERKKNGEYPETALFMGGGQSNYAYSVSALREALAANFANPALAFSPHFSATSLMAWMRDKADGSGYEVTPHVDLTAAPAGSLAYLRDPLHGGDRTLAAMQAQYDLVRRNPKSKVAMLFVQGENDTDDATNQWKPNGVPGGPVDYNAHFTDPYALAESYGARSVAWNNAVRAGTGFPNLVCIYERVAYVNLNRLPIQVECEHRQRKSQLDGLVNDSRYFLVDTADIPREDGIHFTPDGARQFARGAMRLLKRSDKLAALSYHARMLAMRAIDSGMELTDAQMGACEAFVATSEFPKLRSLVIPVLPAANPDDQARLRRCNLLIHRSDKYAPGFEEMQPVNTTAGYEGTANVVVVDASVRALLAAWGLTDTVTLRRDG